MPSDPGFLLLAISCAMAQQSESVRKWGPTAKGLRLGIDVETSTAREPAVVLNGVIVNTTTEAIHVSMASLDVACVKRMSKRLMGSGDWKPVSKTKEALRRESTRNMGVKGSPMGPGVEDRFQWDLHDLFDLSLAGDYKVSLSCTVIIDRKDYVKLESNEVLVTLRNAASPVKP